MVKSTELEPISPNVKREQVFFLLHFPVGSGIIHFKCGCSSSVERQLPKLHRWVRLPSAAPRRSKRHDRLLRLIFISQNALILLLPLSHSDPLRWAHSGRTALWKTFFRYREGCPFQINSPTSSEQLVYSSEEVGLFSAKPRYIKDWLLPYF